jgi:hypothetical protein
MATTAQKPAKLSLDGPPATSEVARLAQLFELRSSLDHPADQTILVGFC